MLYLIDAGVLITANNLYYPVDRVPEFWLWLRDNAEAGRLKMPLECYEEIKEGPSDVERDLLYAWIADTANREALVLPGAADVLIVQRVLGEGYAADLTDDEVEQIGRDPFLVAHAFSDVNNRCVVTTEVSKPRRQRQNRHIPDVCQVFGVQCIDTFELTRRLNFSTSWGR